MRQVVIIVLTLSFAICISACKPRRACERACQCKLKEAAPDSGDPPIQLPQDEWDKCVEKCENDLEKESDGCSDAFHHWARCLDTNVCNPDHCEKDMEKINHRVLRENIKTILGY